MSVNIYNMTDTWNAGGTTFNGIYMNFTNGAAGAPVGAAASRFLRLDNNGSSVFDVDANGFVFSVLLATQVRTLASLPTPASAGSGARMYISDSTAPTFNVTVSGGGTTPMVVWSNGTNWKCG